MCRCATSHRWTLGHGTSICPEACAGPRNTYTRKAVVLCPDGRRRRAWAKVADTFVSIPARCRIRGTLVQGFLTVKDAREILGESAEAETVLFFNPYQ